MNRKSSNVIGCNVKIDGNLFEPTDASVEEFQELLNLFNKLCSDIKSHYGMSPYALDKGVAGKKFGKSPRMLHIYVTGGRFPKLIVRGTWNNHDNVYFKVSKKDKFDNDKLDVLTSFLNKMVEHDK